MEDFSCDHCLLIVTGAHLQAERMDRPLAYRLQQAILTWQQQMQHDDPLAYQLEPLVCSDLWYLNNNDLHHLPVIAIGEPGLNAASAYFANRLPEAFIIDQTLRVQMDQELIDLKACIWGIDHASTESGVELFVDRYLDAFLRSAHELPIG
jgi:hypothetical protein